MPSKSKYYELLKDPRWQKRRLEIMQRDNFECRKCGDTKTTLNVHHRYYVTGRDPWAYPDFALVTFCEDCHKSESQKITGDDWGPNYEREWELAANTFFSAGERLAWDLAVMIGTSNRQQSWITSQEMISALLCAMRDESTFNAIIENYKASRERNQQTNHQNQVKERNPCPEVTMDQMVRHALAK